MQRHFITRQMIPSLSCCLFLVYVASTGPVVAYCDSHHHLDDMDRLGRSVKMLYVPLEMLCTVCPPIGDAFETYGRWCEGLDG